MPLASFLTGANVFVATGLFLAATAVVIVAAPRLTAVTDSLAKRTKFGHSLAGTVLLGASTSLPGIMVTIVATMRGDVALAVANAIGGVVAQTSFLAIADLVHHRGDLFRAAVSPKALTQLGIFLVLLALPLFAISGWPDAAVLTLHPASVAMVIIYVAGLWIASREPEKSTTKQGADQGRNGSGSRNSSDSGSSSGSEGGSDRSKRGSDATPLSHLWGKYVLYVVLIGAAGFVIGTTISPISQSLGLTSVAAGALLTAGATSSPELITAVTAARRGKLHLAVGDIIGGNTFDILFLVAADAVLATSLYSGLGDNIVLLIAIGILLNAILLLGFVRQRSGQSVSHESILILLAYVTLAVLLVTATPQTGS